MSMILAAKAWKIKLGNPIRKMILIKLADNANDDGECWPSYQHIADQCETSRRTVINHINELEKMGLIKKITRKTNRGNSSNKFIITLPSENNSPVKNKGNSLETPSARDSPRSEIDSPHPSEIDSSGSATGSPPSAGDSPTPSAGDSPRISHSLNQSMNHKKINKKEADDIELAFNDFWESGMVKVGKQNAMKAFVRQAKESKLDAKEFADKLTADVKARLAAKQFGFDKLHPTTYLNGRRWEDEIIKHNDSSTTSCGLPRTFGHIDYSAGLTQNEDGSYVF